MFVIDEAAAQLFDRVLKFEPDHKAASTYFLDLREFLQFFQQLTANFGGILHKVLLFDNVHHGKGGRTCQVVTAESGS